MKVKVLCRNPDYYLRETKRDIHKGLCEIRLGLNQYIMLDKLYHLTV
jgi:hypothetical protein